MNSERVVVVGSGLVGAAVSECASQQGYEVLRCSSPRLECQPSTAPADVLETAAAVPPNRLPQWLGELKPTDVLVNAAGIADPGAADEPGLWGANALTPAVLALYAHHAGVARLVHISSVAVAGNRRRVEDSTPTAPHSPYSASKAVGERALALGFGATTTSVRALSIHDPSRKITRRFVRAATSKWCVMPTPATGLSTMSTARQLAEFVLHTANAAVPPPPVIAQPQTGLTCEQVVAIFRGGPSPCLPAPVLKAAVLGLHTAGHKSRAAHALSRQLDVLWFGQVVDAGWARDTAFTYNQPELAIRILGEECRLR
ncbi:nucleoside-diphosphate-sugar epimerase [Phycicoccus badiiscoriae]|uniref:Nucleoside-diphosphate-sugar epimerase n=1 Tax=Pedococcus badiiscoriae TaxID=642776 RepID=A0A852WAI4_9MICO|nr:NAD-dependent epimerase/dehydratase family protein [Pedococcus badiiscoriae]NYG06073.1 nucleoside-diphosphate-sugar epimerase [Pedococcus badiiscoriae]